jgi:hypothetical protein
VNAITESVLMPIRRATGRLNDVARMALPILVRWTMNSRANMTTTATTTIKRFWFVICTPPSE